MSFPRFQPQFDSCSQPPLGMHHRTQGFSLILLFKLAATLTGPWQAITPYGCAVSVRVVYTTVPAPSCIVDVVEALPRTASLGWTGELAQTLCLSTHRNPAANDKHAHREGQQGYAHGVVGRCHIEDLQVGSAIPADDATK